MITRANNGDTIGQFDAGSITGGKLTIGQLVTNDSIDLNGTLDIDDSQGNAAVVDISNAYNQLMTADHYALKVAGGQAAGAPGGQIKAYGGYFTAGNTNGNNPDSIALYAQGHEDGAPNSYAAIFSGSAGGVVGINTMEPTVELDVVGYVKVSSDITASGNVSASGNVYATEFHGDGSNLTNLPSQNDQNFTNAEHTKLYCIEASSDVTATSNVTAAGALMDSEVTSLSLIKGLTAAQISGAFDAASASLASDIPTNNNELTNGAGYTTNTGTVDTTGTPANNQVAVFTDADTIEGSNKLKFDSSILEINSSNSDSAGIKVYGGAIFAATPYITPYGNHTTMNFGDGETGHVFDFRRNKISFDADSTNTYIQADADDPENLEIHADGNIELRADDNLEIHSPISTNITASGDISASGDIITTNLEVDNKITHIGDTDTYLQFAGANDFRIIAGGIDAVKATASEIAFNDGQANYDFRVEGDSEPNLIFADASADKVGIGTNTPGTELEVIGDISSSGDINCDNLTVATSITSVGDDVIIGDDLVLSSEAAKLRFSGSAGGGNEAIQYYDSNGDVRNVVMFTGTNTFSIMNRAPNGTVEIRANSSTAGSSGEVTVATFEDDLIKLDVPQRRLLEVSTTTDGNGNGDFIKLGSTSTTAGKIYYYNSSGNWVETNADAASSSTGLIAVAMSNNSNKGMMLKGMVTLDHDPGTVGDVLYLSTTAGEATSTAPSATGDVVRVIGYCLNSTNGQIYFDPSKDHIVHA